MDLSPHHLEPKTVVLLDPTSHDGETSLGLLGPGDTHTSLLVLLHDPASSALHEFADAEGTDLSTAATFYLDQVADRIAGPHRVVENVVASGHDPAAEISHLVSVSHTRRVLVPASFARLQPNAYRRLTETLGQLIAPYPTADGDNAVRPGAGRTRGRATGLPSRKGIRKALDDSPLAHQTPASELRTLSQLGTIVRVPEHTTVIRQGTPGRQCLVVIDGALTVERDGVWLADLGAGQIAGEVAILTGSPCSANVIAASNTSILALDQSEFATMLDACPTIARHVLKTAMGRIPQAA